MSRLLVLTTVLLLAACTSGLQSNTPPTQTYILRATASPAPVDHPPANRTLQLARVTTDPGLDSDRIVIVQTDHRMGYYALSRWPDDLPEVVEALAASTLRASGDWAAVYEWPGQLPARYTLYIAVRRFEADYTGGGRAPTVHVKFDCQVVRRTDLQQIGAFTAESSVPAEDNRMAAVIDSFERAANSALAVVAERTAAAVSSAEQAATSR